jgi:putative tryptophan/tyrosine transport system substrate-binding protein
MRSDHLRRREFGAAVAWPLSARAQELGRLNTIGYMGLTTPSAQSTWTAPFLRRLRELGWIEGRNLAIEYRWAEGRNDRLAWRTGNAQA